MGGGHEKEFLLVGEHKSGLQNKNKDQHIVSVFFMVHA